MSIDKSTRVAGDVPALDSIVGDVVPANGKVWRITKFTGNGAYLDDTVVCLLWDADGADADPVRVPDLIACTHGDMNQDLDITITGDGVKVLRLALQNDTNDPHVMGGTYKAKER
jgi:hypothetical protein